MAEVCVVGGGPVGLTAAVALAAKGVHTTLLAPSYVGDSRTTALWAGSIAALRALGIWEQAQAHAEPIQAIRLIDDRAGLLRAPELLFRAQEIDLPAFGYNIPNQALVAALEARVATLPLLQRRAVTVIAAETGEATVTLQLQGGARLAARLAVAADGRNSLLRDAAGIRTARWSYPQTALTCNFAHARPHGGASTEFHTRDGPFALVPLPGSRSSLVWVMSPDDAAWIAALDEAALSTAIERQAHSMLGRVRVEPGRDTFPLAGLTAQALCGRRIALVGEAAHVLPPIGAQGFNLGLRDALAIAEVAAAALARARDPGEDAALQAYEARRRGDVASRTLAVDLLNRSLLTGFLPLQGLRGLGLLALQHVGPLRRALIREGVSLAAQSA